MKMFIQIRDGEPYEHPILEANFTQVFPDIDTNNLPANFANFERVPVSWIGVYQIYEGFSYEFVDGIVKDVHNIRDLIVEEKIAKQNKTKEYWATNGYPSWVFDELNCSFVAPIPMPTDGKSYFWKEETQTWEILIN